MATVKKTISIDKEIFEEVEKVRLAERPTLNFSAFATRALWKAIKEKKGKDNERDLERH